MFFVKPKFVVHLFKVTNFLTPDLEILEFKPTLSSNITDIFAVLYVCVGHEIFDFFQTIIL